MKDAQSRITLIKKAIALEKQRSLLEAKLEPLTNRLVAITQELVANTGRQGAAEPSPESLRAPARPAKLSGRGELTAAILSALKSAGAGGLRVQDMAERFSVKVRNLFVWFSTTGRKFRQIKKVAPGRYRLK